MFVGIEPAHSRSPLNSFRLIKSFSGDAVDVCHVLSDPQIKYD